MRRNLFWAADDPAWAARRIGYSDPRLADTVPDAAIEALEQEAEQAQHDGVVNVEVVKLCVGVVGAIAAVTLLAHLVVRAIS